MMEAGLEREVAAPLALKAEEGATCQGMQATPGAGKETDFPLEPTVGTSPADTLILALQDTFLQTF